MKNLLIGIILFFLFSCSSNPQNTIARDQEELLIEKPKINYKLKPSSITKPYNEIKEKDRYLKGFNWRKDEQPKTKEDIIN